jgi:methylated-DNA-[protein]-cysteine S-methyltransferase
MDTVTIQSPIGTLKIKADGTHVHNIEFVHTKRTTLTKSPLLRRCIKELEEYFGGKRRRFTVPFKTKGTEFQKSIWSTMRTVEHGNTVSYGALAKAIKRPKAFRAVANACGKNPLPIIIPCHRITAAKGLGGYTPGMSKKRWLLRHEEKISRSPAKK